MNSEYKELNAECSLCWKCKFGLCVQETEIEKVVHADMRFLGGPPNDPQEEDPFSLTDGMPFGVEEEEAGAGEIEHTIERSRIKTICYWRPDDIEDSPPIGVAKVDQCNRFEKK